MGDCYGQTACTMAMHKHYNRLEIRKYFEDSMNS